VLIVGADMPMPLRVPIQQTATVHMQRRASSALRQIATTLRRAGIRAKARVQYNRDGRGRIMVYVQGMGVTEAQMLLNPWVEGFLVRVV
jgi:hypothetical protein